MGFPTTISRTCPFPVLGVLDGIFLFYLNFNSIFCKQNVETLIRRLIWVCTVCPCPTKRTLGLYGLHVISYEMTTHVRFSIYNIRKSKILVRFQFILQSVYVRSHFVLQCSVNVLKF